MVEDRPREAVRLALPTYRPLVRIRGKQKVPIIARGPVHTWLMHWCGLDLRTQPCVMGRCELCQRFIARRPLSYVAIQHLALTSAQWAWAPAILEVPLSTGVQLAEHRNEPLTARRERPRGPIELEPLAVQKEPPACQPFDIVPALMRLWKMEPGRQLRLLDRDEWSMWNVAND